MPPAPALLLPLLLLGCAKKPAVEDAAARPEPASTPPATVDVATPSPVPLLSGEALGGPGLGFVQGSTQNGRFVFVRRWKPGKEPSFGQHGEAFPSPELVALDYATGEERVIDDLYEIDPRRRFALVADEGEVLLLDANTGEWEALDDVDSSRDGNACLNPRSAVFSMGGGRLGWISAEADALHVRELDSGETWTVPAEGRLWRAWPADEDQGAWMMEVAADAEGWPRQNTSCACRWCNRFAMSFGFYGWGGPAWSITRVGPEGERQAVDGLPEGEGWPWHGETDAGCTLRPTLPGERLDQGPWQWACPDR